MKLRNGRATGMDAIGPTPLGPKGREKVLKTWRKPFAIPDEFPSAKEVLGAIPSECFEKSLGKSFMYATMSVTLTCTLPVIAWKLLPTPTWTPVSIMCWLFFAFWEGTVATGCWVVAHECGHGAFCDNKFLQDLVGYVLHSVLLVPYFSWQRSHAVHHSRTNHAEEGETHVPSDARGAGKASLHLQKWIGDESFAVINLFNHLVLGWPLYLLIGVSGSPKRGFSNHFLPTNESLFPGAWKAKVLASDIGVIIVLSALYKWKEVAGVGQPLVLYVLPYLFTNMWLVHPYWLAQV